MALLVVTAVGLEVLRDRRYGEPRPAQSVLYVRSGDVLERASLSNASLLADLYWIRAIQYYGGGRRSKAPEKHYELLYPLLDITTTLDPKFTIAYRFGAVFLTENPPGGPGRPDLAIALLQKGLDHDPRRWQYEHDLGFVYYWSLHDYRKAADAFRRGADIPGAPWWLRSLAAIVTVQGGDRNTSRRLWMQIYESADNEWLRDNAQLRLAQLTALDRIDYLQALVSEVTRRNGARPTSWTDFIRAGLLRRDPLDPAGTPFVLEPDTGRVTVSTGSKLYPLPTEPAARLGGPPS
jgi:tetratricopeptide (TPR) repeat protein